MSDSPSKFKAAVDEGRIKVDDNDKATIDQYHWCIDGRGYVMAYSHRTSGKKVYVKLHRLLLGASAGQLVDHINGDKLDNRRGNLRVCSKAENVRNQRLRPCNTSGFKGVHFPKDKNRWVAYITVDEKRRHLGYFDCKVEAAKAYDAAAIILHGEFANLNFKNGSK